MIPGQAVEAACLSARKTPGRLAPAGREAGHADASPVALPDVMFLWLLCLLLLLLFFFLFLPFFSCLWLSRASPWRGGLS